MWISNESLNIKIAEYFMFVRCRYIYIVEIYIWLAENVERKRAKRKCLMEKI